MLDLGSGGARRRVINHGPDVRGELDDLPGDEGDEGDEVDGVPVLDWPELGVPEGLVGVDVLGLPEVPPLDVPVELDVVLDFDVVLGSVGCGVRGLDGRG
ncbi:MAG: hypothetical protein ACR2KJ_02385 [Jatrophihabitans sp.]